ncbi:MAG: SUMF1/EgtB/PvdO family nonheme iron enzyme [Actinobacteria bacterium]|nr:SUMF1/EgtB/PvdO family nonheme iron enzyme [Actinomycetota bacterium]
MESEVSVVRGGSWNNNNEANFRCANRNRDNPDNRNNNIGFRVARSAQSIPMIYAGSQ